MFATKVRLVDLPNYDASLELKLEIPHLHLSVRKRPTLPNKDAQNVLIPESGLVKEWLGLRIRNDGEKRPVTE